MKYAKYAIAFALVVVGIIHLLPLSGFLGSERLAALYGIPFAEANLEILMRHRAVLFGVLGTFFIWAAFRPVYQALAFIAGFVSVSSFLYLAIAVGNYNDAIRRVFIADVIALVLLVVGVIAYILSRRRGHHPT